MRKKFLLHLQETFLFLHEFREFCALYLLLHTSWSRNYCSRVTHSPALGRFYDEVLISSSIQKGFFSSGSLALIIGHQWEHQSQIIIIYLSRKNQNWSDYDDENAFFVCLEQMLLTFCYNNFSFYDPSPPVTEAKIPSSNSSSSNNNNMVSRRKILSRSRDDLHEFSYREAEEDIWYQKERLYRVRTLNTHNELKGNVSSSI